MQKDRLLKKYVASKFRCRLFVLSVQHSNWFNSGKNATQNAVFLSGMKLTGLRELRVVVLVVMWCFYLLCHLTKTFAKTTFEDMGNLLTFAFLSFPELRKKVKSLKSNSGIQRFTFRKNASNDHLSKKQPFAFMSSLGYPKISRTSGTFLISGAF